MIARINTEKIDKHEWINEEELYKCVHCGFCLQACPTYLTTGLETESPRGRIALMKAVNEGRLNVDDGILRHWDLCIQCRACEVVCPSGVPYGNLIESVMDKVRSKRKVTFFTKLVHEISFHYLIPSQRLLTWIKRLLWIYTKSGLQRAVRATRILKLISVDLCNLESNLPNLNGKAFVANDQIYPSKEGRVESVWLLSGCIMPLVQGDQMRSAVDVLNENGFEVVVPSAQVCCGAINSHVGDIETTRQLAHRNIEAFSPGMNSPIVSLSAGCGARLKEYSNLFKKADRQELEKVREFESRVVDINEFLAKLPVKRPKARLDKRVTYQDSCHLANVQGIKNQPRELIKCIDGIDFVEMPGSGICCGAGGTYMITEPQMSERVLEIKIDNIAETRAEVVATANPGCFIQLQNGIRKRGLDIDVKYVTDLLSEAYEDKKENRNGSRS